MKITYKEITIRDLTDGFQDNEEGGVVGYSGKLDIRPPYQREFVYNDKQRDAVINTVLNGFPLNVMYWAVNDADEFEIIDGQQRTISVCQYVDGRFPFGGKFFTNLQPEEQKRILDYKITVYFCEGTGIDKLAWFQTINIAGVKLTDQELLNAAFVGPWLADAKRFFSKPNCPAYGMANEYMKGSPIRQDYLETVIGWISKGKIEAYMAKNQHAASANPLWLYFKFVISWAQATFPHYRKEMKGLDWGHLYDTYKDVDLDPKALEERITELMMDEDVTKKRGIYEYVLDGNPKHLNIRAFSPTQRREVYERQAGICAVCGEHFTLNQMEADHITPWHEGGRTRADNCQMLCKEDNRRKAGK